MTTLLLVLSLAGNITWLVTTLVRWWLRATPQARALAVVTAVAYVCVWAGVRALAGPLAGWVIGLAGVGLLVATTGALIITGYAATRHAIRLAPQEAARAQVLIAAVEAERRREITR